MATNNVPGKRKVSVNTSSKPSGGRKTKTIIVSLKRKPGSAKKK